MTPTVVMLPKEHGAWAQMLLPLATATVVVGPSYVSLAVLAAFLAHEPLLVALGARGSRARRDDGARALRWLWALLAAGVACGAVGIAGMAAADRWTVLLPLVPAVAVCVELGRQRTKSAMSEVCAAAALPLAAVPAVAATGASPATGLAIAVPFVAVFVVATVTVRDVVQAGRHASTPPAPTCGARAAWLAVAAATALLALVDQSAMPRAAALAALPGLIVAAAVALAPPQPRHLRRVGWLLAGASVATSAILVTMR